MSINFTKILIWIFAVSISFYTAGITKFSLIYFIYLSILPLVLIVLLQNRVIHFSYDILLAVLLLLYVSLSQFNYIYQGEFINIFIALEAYIAIRMFANNISSNFVIKTSHIMIWVSILAMIIDSYYRLDNPIGYLSDFYGESNKWFYKYKHNSIIFANSNTMALIALILFFFIASIEKIGVKNNYYKIPKIILALLIFLSFSRGAIIALIFGLIAMYYSNNRITTKFFLVIVAFLFAFIIYGIYIEDGSLKSKLYIVNSMFDVFADFSIINMLFGIGFNQSSEVLGIYSHLLYTTLLLDTGIVGLVLYLLFIAVYIYKFNSIIFTPVLITSFSYFMYIGTPFLFVPLALLANLMDKGKIHSQLKKGAR